MSATDDRRGVPGPAPGIEVQCLSCGRFGAFDGADRRVEGAPLVELTRRLRCSACGSRAVRAIKVRTPRDVARSLRARMGGSVEE